MSPNSFPFLPRCTHVGLLALWLSVTLLLPKRKTLLLIFPFRALPLLLFPNDELEHTMTGVPALGRGSTDNQATNNVHIGHP